MRNFFSENRGVLYLLGVFLTICISVSLYSGYQTYKSVEAGDTESCILSLQDSLMLTFHKEEVRNVISLNQEWRILNKNEQDFLFNSMNNPRRLDCFRFSNFTEGKSRSGKDLHISARYINELVQVHIERFE
jgi:hypothetical protein